MRREKSWSEDEIRYLQYNHCRGMNELKRRLGRTEEGIRSKMAQLRTVGLLEGIEETNKRATMERNMLKVKDIRKFKLDPGRYRLHRAINNQNKRKEFKKVVRVIGNYDDYILVGSNGYRECIYKTDIFTEKVELRRVD